MLDEKSSRPPDLMDADDSLRIVLPGTMTAVRRALIQLRDRLESLELSVEEVGTLELVLAEALNNIVEHAYSKVSGVIEIEVSRMNDGLQFVITDYGAEMPDGKPPGGILPDPNVGDELPEGGFGWFLIHDLTHDLSYHRDGGRNRLCFRLALGRFAD